MHLVLLVMSDPVDLFTPLGDGGVETFSSYFRKKFETSFRDDFKDEYIYSSRMASNQYKSILCFLCEEINSDDFPLLSGHDDDHDATLGFGHVMDQIPWISITKR